MELILIGIGAIGFIIYRQKRLATLRKKVNATIPPEHSLIWDSTEQVSRNVDDLQEKSGPNWKQGLASAGMIGAIGSIPSLTYLSQIDENVLEAMDFAFTEDLSNFYDFHNYINDKYLDAVSADSAEGWMTRLEGYVNEQYAADVLTDLGYEVEFPTSANQEGWDLLVNGEPWQVKGGHTPSVIADHLEKNPDIPVVTSDVLKEHSAEQEAVIGLQELDPDVIEQVTEQTIGAADSLGDTMGIGVPIVTLAASGFREFKLLTGGQTDITNAMKNVGLDVAGTGGGGLVGAKLGATIGAVGGPVGFAIGGVLGAIGGAILGRTGTNLIKNINYKHAVENYQLQLEQSKQQVNRTTDHHRAELEQHILSVNQQLNHARKTIVEEYEFQWKQVERSYIEKQKQFVKKTPDMLRDIKARLIEIQQEEVSRIKRSGLIRRLFAPTQQDVYYARVNQWFEDRIRLVDEAMTRFSHIPTDERGYRDRYKEILHFFRNHPADYDMLNTSLEDLASIDGSDLYEIRDDTRRRLFEEIDQAERSTRQQVNRSFSEIYQTIMDHKRVIQEKIDKVRMEAAKLGHNIE